MKLWIFIIILIILYYIATQIRVVHISTLPDKEKKELENKNKLKEMLKPSYIKTFGDREEESFKKSSKNISEKNILQEYFGSDLYSKKNNNIVDKIKNKYLDSNHEFNIPNLPINIGKPNKNIMKSVWREIDLWNMVDPNIKIKGINPEYISETIDEFLIKVNVLIEYLGKYEFLQTIYYGKYNKNDDPFRNKNKYILQLVAIKEITKKEYYQNNEIEKPFMTMDEQMEYVAKINKMHADE